MAKKVKVEYPVYIGTYMGTKQGFGFVRVDDLDEDIFVSERRTGSAMNGDTVRVVVIKQRENGRHKSEGEIDRVLKRALTSIVGTFQKNGKTTFVLPDDTKLPDFYIPKGMTQGAKNGQKVQVEITAYPEEGKSPEGAVTRVLGYLTEPGVDVESVISGMELPTDFPIDVAKEARRLPSSVSRADRKGRRDFRDLVTVTIDGDDTKDFDDAITLSRTKTGYELGVHIADVSHYVTEDSLLDREALKRGTSIYLADRVIPMLPRKLSNGICSLNEGEDRLTLSCVMQLNEHGKVVSHEIVESVINVNERMTYHDVAALIEMAHGTGSYRDSSLNPGAINESDGTELAGFDNARSDKKNRTGEKQKSKLIEISLHQIKKAAKSSGGESLELFNRYKKRIPWYLLMEEVAGKLNRRRIKHGSIDFDLPECKIDLDASGRPTDIYPYDRNIATRIIEEFMLAANRTVAEEAYWLELPFVYRCHDEPDREKIKDLSRVTAFFGHSMKIGQGEIHPKTIRSMLDSIKDTPEESFLTQLTLRAMMRAEYRTSCDGHFGLAAKYYCHFTSPIRRYPDLQIHRILKEYRHGGMAGGGVGGKSAVRAKNSSSGFAGGMLPPERMSHYAKILSNVARKSSELERRADEAEREVDRLKKVAYMEDHIGDEYEGVISGVTSWGIYVELPNTVEGMVRLTDMKDDRYDYEEEKFRVIGHRSRRIYRLGQTVRVQVARVDLTARTIDFIMLDE
ncbi:MAG: RNB domain-containing ribonuclease [Eubacterium sp.]|nr:RNB domain-containing ribonuclease [Eubacterium sp.]